MQSPTFSEEVDKLARKASLRPTPQPIGDIPMDEPHQVAHLAQLVPAQIAAQPMASMQAATAPSALIQPDPRSIYRHRDFTPPRYQYPLQPQFQEEQEHMVPSCFFCHGYHYSSGCQAYLFRRQHHDASRLDLHQPDILHFITYTNSIFYNFNDFHIYINSIFYDQSVTR
ncbi:unnamed protein product [Heligmosomoides polygyrus]|uniref:Uncharacterized protein n=1 Tax=Heligmosomoides polygyrus TaxID=6339 RepID=A0A183GCA4_HELPZ|nr:unnamed protein product [Heligmosomoides polygyrus]